MDTRKSEKKIRGLILADLYLRCRSEPIQHHPTASPVKVGQLLRPARDDMIELIQSNKTLERFCATPITTHKTLLWMMEVCTDPFSAQYKLYQLFRPGFTGPVIIRKLLASFTSTTTLIM
jgi:hypothetical protein